MRAQPAPRLPAGFDAYFASPTADQLKKSRARGSPGNLNPMLLTDPFAGARTGVRIERILCPLDFSDVSAKVYRYAQSIASHYRAKLLVQHAVEMWRHPSGDYCVSVEAFDDLRRKLLSSAEEQLQRLVRTSGCLQPECIVEEGMAEDAIQSLARAREIDLIVLGTHGGGFARLMLGSVTERVLRHAPCPVLTVRQAAPEPGTEGATDEPIPIRRILCCVDFSARSRRALECALSAADAYDAEVSVLRVLDNISCPADAGNEMSAALENLEKLCLRGGPRYAKTHLEVRVGREYHEILKFAAEAHSDLIVAGLRGRHALDLALSGSTNSRMLDLSPVPVLAVPI
jgi:nucleotide-binding universal stress UspA family protein